MEYNLFAKLHHHMKVPGISFSLRLRNDGFGVPSSNKSSWLVNISKATNEKKDKLHDDDMNVYLALYK